MHVVIAFMPDEVKELLLAAALVEPLPGTPLASAVELLRENVPAPKDEPLCLFGPGGDFRKSYTPQPQPSLLVGRLRAALVRLFDTEKRVKPSGQ